MTHNIKLETQNPFLIPCGPHTLDCRPGQPIGAHVMGILNVTPDSFSDGGRYTTTDAALLQTERMLEDGAAIIDVGGESTRPGGRTYGSGAEAVAEERERERVLPIVEAVVSKFPEAIVSIDTYKPAIARDALDAGAHIVNDVTGLRLYPEMADVVAEHKAPLILMHSLGRPGEMPHEHSYKKVVDEVLSSLEKSVYVAQQSGVTHLITDPGFGFGKTPAENMQLIGEVNRFLELGYPVLVGISRKSTIGILLGEPDAPVPVDERLFGTLGATAVAIMRGASIVRTHDVRPTVEMLKMLGATLGIGPLVIGH